MEDLLKSVWLQGGALGLLGISGWVAWYFERRRNQSLLDTFIEMVKDNTIAMTKMEERLK